MIYSNRRRWTRKPLKAAAVKKATAKANAKGRLTMQQLRQTAGARMTNLTRR